jgi:hypothetical protein
MGPQHERVRPKFLGQFDGAAKLFDAGAVIP